MTKDARQFLQFIAILIVFGFSGGMIVNQHWARGYEAPLGILWIIALLAVIGFIISGMDGLKTLVTSTLLMWFAAIVFAGFIAWMAIAGAGHNF